jgi:hypothetical protein
MAATMFAAIVDTAAAGELKWQRGKTPVVQRAAQKQAKATHRDGAVRLVQYEVVSGPSFGRNDSRQLRSVVVPRNESADGELDQVRTAQQLDWGGAEPDSRYEDQVRTPFGDDPAAGSPGLEQEVDQDLGEDLFPPLDEPPAEQPPAPSDEDLSLPPPNDQPTLPRRQPMAEPRQPAAQPPRTFQPRPSQQPLPGGRDAEPLPRDMSSDEPQSDLGYDFDDAPSGDVSCSEELAKLKASTLHDVDLAVGVAGVEGEDYPVECSIDDGTWHPGRCWPQTVYMWKASALCHKPLYFEDEALERYGHSWGPCCDPIVSGAHFFSKLAVLPYCMGLATPCECQYALGHYRPGSCAPYMCDPVPITARAALMQAGAVVGTAALLP